MINLQSVTIKEIIPVKRSLFHKFKKYKLDISHTCNVHLLFFLNLKIMIIIIIISRLPAKNLPS